MRRRTRRSGSWRPISIEPGGDGRPAREN